MDIERCKLQIRKDEGESLEVYADSKGILTVGVGHKVLPSDGLALGDKISQAECMARFELDFESHLKDAKRLFENWEALPDLIQEVLANMCFNLGVVGLGRFRHMCIAVKHLDWHEMKAEMIDSGWYNQVGERAVRLCAMVQKVIDERRV